MMVMKYRRAAFGPVIELSGVRFPSRVMAVEIPSKKEPPAGGLDSAASGPECGSQIGPNCRMLDEVLAFGVLEPNP